MNFIAKNDTIKQYNGMYVFLARPACVLGRLCVMLVPFMSFIISFQWSTFSNPRVYNGIMCTAGVDYYWD